MTVPSRVLLEQFADEFPTYCKVGMGYNKNINYSARGFVAVTDSVHRLQNISFDAAFVDEAHHPVPQGMPQAANMHLFSATLREKALGEKGNPTCVFMRCALHFCKIACCGNEIEKWFELQVALLALFQADFQYTMRQAIEDGVLCDYDLTVPLTSKAHPYLCLAEMLQSEAGRFRRVLAYCNSVHEAKRFQQLLESFGLAAWHINGRTRLRVRQQVLGEFTGPLQKPVHVLVTVQVLGEGINIRNADTCMFVEPRSSYTSIVQAIGRVLRKNPAKPLAHIVLPAVAVVANASMPEAVHRDGGRLDASNEAPLPTASAPKPQIWNVAPTQREVRHHKHECTHPSTYRTSNTAARMAAADSSRSTFKDLASSQLSKDLEKPGGKVIADAATSKMRKHQQGSFVEKGCCPRPAKMANVPDGELDHAPGTAFQLQVEATLRPADMAERLPSDGVSVAAAGEQDREQHTRNPARVRMRQVRHARPTDEGYSMQVERFLAVIAMADSRLHDKSLSSRLRIVDVRQGRPTASLLPIATDVLTQLSLVLAQGNPWEARLQAVEEFVAEQGRLPVERGPSVRESLLGCWLRNVGVRLRQKVLSTYRVQRFMNSTSPLVRARAWDWLGQDVVFRKRCDMLREYIHENGALPNLSRNTCSTHTEQQLGLFLLRLKKGSFHVTLSRLQFLKGLHPYVRDLLESWEGNPDIVMMSTWRLRISELKSAVKQSGRLPSPMVPAEKSIYWWLSAQKYRFLMLPAALQQQLTSIDPDVAAFVQAR